MAKILLIYPAPDEQKNSRFGFSLTLLYISSILKANRHNVFLKDYSLQTFDEEDLQKTLVFIDVVIVEFDSFPLKRSGNIISAQQIVDLVKKEYPSVKVIAFGKDCVLCPRQVKNADFTITTEPESVISEVVDGVLKNNNIVQVNINDKLNYLDQLPFPDRKIVQPLLSRFSGKAKSTLIETSRGCLNSCVFCQRRGWHSTFRTHSLNYVIKEFVSLKEDNYSNVWITDDNFTFNLDRAKSILEQLLANRLCIRMNLALSSWTKIDRAFLNLAKAANVSLISFGIESTNPEVLNFYQKDIDPFSVKDLITYADSIGLYTVGNFIIGAPMETQKTIDDTFKFILSTPFDQVNIKILDYMIGSKLFEQLPLNIRKNKRHIFASKENGLNAFSLSDLQGQIKTFKALFAIIQKSRLMYKMKKFGLPYQV